MSTRMQQKRGTASQWASVNPVLAAGEIGAATDSGVIKVGDGVRKWNDLPSSGGILEGEIEHPISIQAEPPTGKVVPHLWVRNPPVAAEDNVYMLAADGKWYGATSGQSYRPITDAPPEAPVETVFYEAPFEINLSNWTSNGSATVVLSTTRFEEGGTASAEVTATAVGGFGTRSPGIPLEPSTEFRFVVTLSNASSTDSFTVQVEEYSASGWLGAHDVINNVSVPNETGNVFQTYEGLLVTNANHKDVAIVVRRNNNTAGSGTKFFVGNVKVYKGNVISTPPPQSNEDLTGQIVTTKDYSLADGVGYPPAVNSLSTPPDILGPTTNWNTIFTDEFNGTEIDRTKWNIGYHWWGAPGRLIHKSSGKADGCWMPLNSDGSTIKSVLEVVNGQLLMKTRRQVVSGQPAEHPFTGAVINTVNKVVIPGGTTDATYTECRIHVPVAKATFSAPLWFMGIAHDNGDAIKDWPHIGEIDGLETVSNDNATGDWNFTLHWYDPAFATSNNGGHLQHHYEINTLPGHPYFDSWHLLGVLRTPNRIEIYVDRKFIAGWTRGVNYLKSGSSPLPDVLFHRDENIYLDQKIGGDWGGQGIPVSDYQPGTLAHDWIRVWHAIDHTKVVTAG